MTALQQTIPAQPSRMMARPIVDLARSVAAIDPTLLPELAATAVAVDAHAVALETTLHRFNTLEGRLGQAVQRLRRAGRQISEAQFAALLDYTGDSDARVRIEQLRKAFPP
jgi:hypothetical protein